MNCFFGPMFLFLNWNIQIQEKTKSPHMNILNYRRKLLPKCTYMLSRRKFTALFSKYIEYVYLLQKSCCQLTRSKTVILNQKHIMVYISFVVYLCAVVNALRASVAILWCWCCNVLCIPVKRCWHFSFIILTLSFASNTTRFNPIFVRIMWRLVLHISFHCFCCSSGCLVLAWSIWDYWTVEYWEKSGIIYEY